MSARAATLLTAARFSASNWQVARRAVGRPRVEIATGSGHPKSGRAWPGPGGWPRHARGRGSRARGGASGAMGARRVQLRWRWRRPGAALAWSSGIRFWCVRRTSAHAAERRRGSTAASARRRPAGERRVYLQYERGRPGLRQLGRGTTMMRGGVREKSPLGSSTRNIRQRYLECRLAFEDGVKNR